MLQYTDLFALLSDPIRFTRQIEEHLTFARLANDERITSFSARNNSYDSSPGCQKFQNLYSNHIPSTTKTYLHNQLLPSVRFNFATYWTVSISYYYLDFGGPFPFLFPFPNYCVVVFNSHQTINGTYSRINKQTFGGFMTRLARI